MLILDQKITIEIQDMSITHSIIEANLVIIHGQEMTNVSAVLLAKTNNILQSEDQHFEIVINFQIADQILGISSSETYVFARICARVSVCRWADVCS